MEKSGVLALEDGSDNSGTELVGSPSSPSSYAIIEEERQGRKWYSGAIATFEYLFRDESQSLSAPQIGDLVDANTATVKEKVKNNNTNEEKKNIEDSTNLDMAEFAMMTSKEEEETEKTNRTITTGELRKEEASTSTVGKLQSVKGEETSESALHEVVTTITEEEIKPSENKKITKTTVIRKMASGNRKAEGQDVTLKEKETKASGGVESTESVGSKETERKRNRRERTLESVLDESEHEGGYDSDGEPRYVRRTKSFLGSVYDSIVSFEGLSMGLFVEAMRAWTLVFEGVLSTMRGITVDSCYSWFKGKGMTILLCIFLYYVYGLVGKYSSVMWGHFYRGELPDTSVPFWMSPLYRIYELQEHATTRDFMKAMRLDPDKHMFRERLGLGTPEGFFGFGMVHLSYAARIWFIIKLAKFALAMFLLGITKSGNAMNRFVRSSTTRGATRGKSVPIRGKRMLPRKR